MTSIWRTAVSGILAALLGACAVVRFEPPIRLALLAPFEGRYREVGYQALYAVRLALDESAVGDGVELLAVDDGGNAEQAAARARALALETQVRIVIVLGYAATETAVLREFHDLPVVVAGFWGAQPSTSPVFINASADLPGSLTVPARIDVTEAAELPGSAVGGDVYTLAAFPRLRRDLNSIRVVSSALLPDAAFAGRYAADNPFAPQPGLIAMTAYESAQLVLDLLAAENAARADLVAALNAVFEGGYRRHAPLYTYTFDAGRRLVPVDDVVEHR